MAADGHWRVPPHLIQRRSGTRPWPPAASRNCRPLELLSRSSHFFPEHLPADGLPDSLSDTLSAALPMPASSICVLTPSGHGHPLLYAALFSVLLLLPGPRPAVCTLRAHRASITSGPLAVRAVRSRVMAAVEIQDASDRASLLIGPLANNPPTACNSASQSSSNPIGTRPHE